MEDYMSVVDLVSGNRGPVGPATLRDAADIVEAGLLDVSILFTGHGSVRELAERIHALRRGRRGQLTVIDCGWSEALLEERLFDVLCASENDPDDCGPAAPRKERATLLLEEVGTLSMDQQQRLLDSLDKQSLQRRTRVRVLASSSEPLLPRVQDGTFNERLYYRLNSVHIVLPCDDHAVGSGYDSSSICG
jgi:DNA-binding NtrC family response regulator